MQACYRHGRWVGALHRVSSWGYLMASTAGGTIGIFAKIHIVSCAWGICWATKTHWRKMFVLLFWNKGIWVYTAACVTTSCSSQGDPLCSPHTPTSTFHTRPSRLLSKKICGIPLSTELPPALPVKQSASPLVCVCLPNLTISRQRSVLCQVCSHTARVTTCWYHQVRALNFFPRSKFWS